MIIYNRSAFGVNLLFRIRGSSVYRTIFPSLLSVGLYCLLHYVYNDGKIERERELGHPYAVGVLVGSITFLIVFRANQGYARYWEGASSTHHMMSKWMDATVHSCVYHLQCDHYKDIKPPSYFDYPELNDLFLTRDRERGQEYYQQAIAANVQQPQQPQHDDDHENNIDNHEEEEDEDPRLTPAMGRRNHTFPMDSKSSSPTTTTPIRRERRSSVVRQSITSISTTLSERKMERELEREIQRAEKEANKIKYMEQMQRAKVKSINTLTPKSEKLLDNSRHNRRSLSSSSSSLLLFSPRSNSSSTKRRKQQQQQRRTMSLPGIGELSSSTTNDGQQEYDENNIINNNNDDDMFTFDDSEFIQKLTFGERPYPLVGKPRLDGNWSKLYKGGKRVFCHETNNPKGFASIEGGRSPPLFLQELAHLSSLLVAVALSTLRNDMEGFESPLAFYEPGKPWPEVDPDKDEFVKKKGLKNWLVQSFWKTFLGVGRSPSEQTRYNAARPLPVIGGVSDAEIVFLQMARGPLAKTQLCWNWLSEFIIREHLAGSMGIVGPPIISRIIQFLGDGMIYYNHARKIMFIPFPFVHAQLSVLFTLVLVPSIPFLMEEYVDEVWLAITLTFFTVMCLTGIHEVARDLENPFRNVPNDLPLVTFQAQYNEALLTMYSGWHPDHFWDGDKLLGRKKTHYQEPLTPATSSQSTTSSDPSGEIEQLKQQLAEQNKIIQQLLKKISPEDDTKMVREASFHPRHNERSEEVPYTPAPKRELYSSDYSSDGEAVQKA